jgi:hypothetical protein
MKRGAGKKAAIKSLMGKYYKDILFKMLQLSNNAPETISIAAAMDAGEIPKNVYHYLSHMLKDDNTTKQICDGVMAAIISAIQGSDPDRLYKYLMFCKEHKYNPSFGSWITWRDTHSMADQLGIRLRTNKLLDMVAVSELHDKFVGFINRDGLLLKDNTKFEPFDHPTKEYEGFRFDFLSMPSDLAHEGRTMRHCVANYSTSCAKGNSLIFSMRKGDRSYITIELYGGDYEIMQKYTLKDNTIENKKILKIIDDWHKDLLKLHEKDETNYYDMVQSKIKERRKIELEALKREIASDELPLSQEDSNRLADLQLESA